MADDNRSAEEFALGDWSFSVPANELRRGEMRRRLEPRAARTLELLCQKRGAIVSQEKIVSEVWGGRAVSTNSVPVVIRDLRQALEDDARIPRYIETVAKRGYRLLNVRPLTPSAPVLRPSSRSRTWTVAALPLLAAILIIAFVGSSRDPASVLVMADVVNDTGRTEFDPLARATSEVILVNLKRLEKVEVSRLQSGEPKGEAVVMKSRLVIWSGKPTVMLSVEDEKGIVIWTGMTSGGEDVIPRDVARAIANLSDVLQLRSGG